MNKNFFLVLFFFFFFLQYSSGIGVGDIYNVVINDNSTNYYNYTYVNETNNITINYTTNYYTNITFNLTNNITTTIINNLTQNITVYNNLTNNITNDITNNYYTNITNNLTNNITTTIINNLTQNITVYNNLTQNITIYNNITNDIINNLTQNITIYTNITNNFTNNFTFKALNTPIFFNGQVLLNTAGGEINISINVANATQAGILSFEDWNNFNNKLNSSDQRYNETALIIAVNNSAIHGNGTINYIPLFNGEKILGNSNAWINGNELRVNYDSIVLTNAADNDDRVFFKGQTYGSSGSYMGFGDLGQSFSGGYATYYTGDASFTGSNANLNFDVLTEGDINGVTNGAIKVFNTNLGSTVWQDNNGGVYFSTDPINGFYTYGYGYYGDQSYTHMFAGTIYTDSGFYGDGSGLNNILPSGLSATNSYANGYAPIYNSSSTTFTWVNISGGGDFNLTTAECPVDWSAGTGLIGYSSNISMKCRLLVDATAPYFYVNNITDYGDLIVNGTIYGNINASYIQNPPWITSTEYQSSSGGWTNTSNISYTNNRVGIGTNDPLNELEVSKDGNASISVISSTGTNQVPSIKLTRGTYFVDAFNDWEFLNNGGQLLFNTYSTSGTKTVLTLDTLSRGFVGIGTSVPNGVLHLNSTGTVIPLNRDLVISGSLSAIGAGRNIIFTNANTETVMAYVGLTTDPVGNQGELVFGTASSTTVNATERVRIDNSGNVGIGTTVPAFRLDVNSTANSAQAIRIINFDSGTSARAGVSTTSDAGSLSIFSPSQAYSSVPAWTNNSVMAFSGKDLWIHGVDGEDPSIIFALNTSSSTGEKMRLLSNGNVGIGTNIPTNTLSIAGSTKNISIDNDVETDFGLLLRDTQDYTQRGGLIYGAGSNLLSLMNNGVNGIVIDLAGSSNIGNNALFVNYTSKNVGIGTTTPSYKFDVVGGDIQLSASQYLRSQGYALMTFSNISNKVSVGNTNTNTNLQLYAGDPTRTIFMNGTNGFVSIGATIPVSALYVQGTTTINRSLVLTTGETDSGVFAMGANDLILNATAGTYTFWGYNGGYAPILSMDDNQKIGIGTLTPGQALDVVGSLRLNSTNIVDLSPGSAGTFDRLDFKAVRQDLGISFQLNPNGGNSKSKIALTNTNSTSIFGSGYIGVDNATMYIATQSVGAANVNVTNLVIGLSSTLGGTNFDYVNISSNVSISGVATVQGSQVCTAANGLCVGGGGSVNGTSINVTSLMTNVISYPTGNLTINDASDPVITFTSDDLTIAQALIQTNGYKRFFLDDDQCGTQTTTGEMWFGTAIASGTTTSDAGYMTHPCVRALRSSTTANSGYAFSTGTSSLLLNGSESTDIIFSKNGRASPLNMTTAILGFTDSVTATAPVDGVYLQISNLTAFGRVRTNNVQYNTSNNFTIIADTWYRLRINIINSTEAQFYLYNSTSNSGTGDTNLVWESNVTGVLPTTTGRQTGHGVTTWVTGGTAAANILLNDYMSITFNRKINR